jgi:hypothetical protein
LGLRLGLRLGLGLGGLVSALLLVAGLRLLLKPLLVMGVGLLLERRWGGGFLAAALLGGGLLPEPGTISWALPLGGGGLGVDCLPRGGWGWGGEPLELPPTVPGV